MAVDHADDSAWLNLLESVKEQVLDCTGQLKEVQSQSFLVIGLEHTKHMARLICHVKIVHSSREETKPGHKQFVAVADSTTVGNLLTLLWQEITNLTGQQ